MSLELIQFRLIKESYFKKTKVWGCYITYGQEKLYQLGIIRWYKPWKGYCFFPRVNTRYGPESLKMIFNFICDEMQKTQGAVLTSNNERC